MQTINIASRDSSLEWLIQWRFIQQLYGFRRTLWWSFDTNNDDDSNSQSFLESFSSQISDPECPRFWSSELHPVSIAPLSEETGPSHNANILKYFLLMVSEDFFERVSIETNRYAAQEFEKRGHRDADWFGTSPQEIET